MTSRRGPLTRLKKRQKEQLEEGKVLQEILTDAGCYERGMELQEMKDMLDALTESTNDVVVIDNGGPFNSTMVEIPVASPPGRKGRRRIITIPDTESSDSEEEPIVLMVKAVVHHPMDYDPQAEGIVVEAEVHHSLNYSPNVNGEQYGDYGTPKVASSQVEGQRKRSIDFDAINFGETESSTSTNTANASEGHETTEAADILPSKRHRRNSKDIFENSDDSGLEASEDSVPDTALNNA